MKTNHLFQPVGTKQTLVNRVVQNIEDAIVKGSLKPNTKLPPERELANQLGVSRSVVREAIQILVAKGLLNSRRGSGTTVHQPTVEQIVGTLSLLVQTSADGTSFEQLHQIRTILEVSIAGIAAQAATEEDLANLKQIMAAMEAAKDDPKLFAAKDTDFHKTLALATHNPLLIIFLNTIWNLLQEYITAVVPRLSLKERILPYHQAILDKVVARDVTGAREAMRQHLIQVAKNHEDAFGKDKL